jgi:hypothetical protein
MKKDSLQTAKTRLPRTPVKGIDRSCLLSGALLISIFLVNHPSSHATETDLKLAQVSKPIQKSESNLEGGITNNLQIYLGGDNRFGEACYLPRSTLGQNLFPDENESKSELAPGLESLSQLSEQLAQSGADIEGAREPLEKFFSNSSLQIDFTVIKEDKRLSLKEKWKGEIWMSRDEELQFSFRLGDQWISTPESCPSPEAACLVRANLSTQKGYMYNNYEVHPPQGLPFLDILILKADRWDQWQDLYSLNFVEEEEALYHYVLEDNSNGTIHLWLEESGSLQAWEEETARQSIRYNFKPKERELASDKKLINPKDPNWKILRF